MGTIYDRIEELCNKRGITGGKMCNDLGFSRSTMTELRKGRVTTLKLEKAGKIADYFGVTVDYLLTGEQKETPVTDNDDELNEYLEMLRTRPECRILMKTVKGATKAEVEENVRFIEALRQAKGND